jgi:hypothetical protein
MLVDFQWTTWRYIRTLQPGVSKQNAKGTFGHKKEEVKLRRMGIKEHH